MRSFLKFAPATLLPLALALAGCVVTEGGDETLGEAAEADNGATTSPAGPVTSACGPGMILQPVGGPSADPTAPPCGPGTLIQSLQLQVGGSTYYPGGFYPGYYGSAYAGRGYVPGYGGYYGGYGGPGYYGPGYGASYYGGGYYGPGYGAGYYGPGYGGYYGPGYYGGPTGAAASGCTCVPAPTTPATP